MIKNIQKECKTLDFITNYTIDTFLNMDVNNFNYGLIINLLEGLNDNFLIQDILFKNDYILINLLKDTSNYYIYLEIEHNKITNIEVIENYKKAV